MTIANESWKRFQRYMLQFDKINLALDISKVDFEDADFEILR